MVKRRLVQGEVSAPSPKVVVATSVALSIIYFWWSHIKGIPESSGKALRIMYITTVMVVVFLIWCPITLLIRGPSQIPPAPVPANLHFSPEGLGWLQGTFWPQIPFVAIVI